MFQLQLFLNEWVIIVEKWCYYSIYGMRYYQFSFVCIKVVYLFNLQNNITPLHVSAKWGRTNMVNLLLDSGADHSCTTRDGLTPLHCGARSGHDQVVDILLEKGAPVTVKTKNGLTPLHMAAQGDHADCARILLYHKAPIDEVTVVSFH